MRENTHPAHFSPPRDRERLKRPPSSRKVSLIGRVSPKTARAVKRAVILADAEFYPGEMMRQQAAHVGSEFPAVLRILNEERKFLSI